jgi:hypothetical protein
VRSFELLIFDEDKKIIARYPLEKVEKPQGLGFSQEISVISTNTIDYITKHVLKKEDITLTILFEEPSAYFKANAFRSWYCKHIRDKLTLKYEDGALTRYIDVVIKKAEVAEIDTGFNAVPVTLQPLSPFYTLKLKKVISTIATENKAYPYSYPYSYGGGILSDGVISNEFFERVPLRVEILGPLNNPLVMLQDESQQTYAQVKFSNVSLLAGGKIVIDAIEKRIYYQGSPTAAIEDYYNKVDKAFNTFLFANPGISTIIGNLTANTASSLNVTYVQYVM